MIDTNAKTTWLPETWRYQTSVLILCTAVYVGELLGTAAPTALEIQIVADLDLTYGSPIDQQQTQPRDTY